MRFREAMGALHDVVVSDLRYQPRDKTAYEAYKAEQRTRDAEIRRQVASQARAEILKEALPELPEGYVADLDRRYRKLRKSYWGARQKYSNYLSRHDPELWRLLMPCDPVITVAPDCLFFECFSADESSYGCLTVEPRRRSSASMASLRGPRTSIIRGPYTSIFRSCGVIARRGLRLILLGFEVAVEQAGGYREEKIDLPQGWLRGFMQLQAAMSLPMRRVGI